VETVGGRARVCNLIPNCRVLQRVTDRLSIRPHWLCYTRRRLWSRSVIAISCWWCHYYRSLR